MAQHVRVADTERGQIGFVLRDSLAQVPDVNHADRADEGVQASNEVFQDTPRLKEDVQEVSVELLVLRHDMLVLRSWLPRWSRLRGRSPRQCWC